MKRHFILTILCSLVMTTLFARNSADNDILFERTYIATDKAAYVSGDRIWCSAFCFDLNSGKLSSQSSVAYVEVLCDGAIMQTSKIALEGGRGNGYLDLPESMPTGNYRLVAFTAVNKAENGYDILQNSKVISVFNPITAQKIPGGVDILSKEEYGELENNHTQSTGNIKIDVPSSMERGQEYSFNIENTSSKPVTLSISVYHDDGIVPSKVSDITKLSLPSSSSLKYAGNVEAEKEGEIIRGRVVGPDVDKIKTQNYATAYISTPGSLNDTYTSKIGQDGSISFKTYNIFGKKDLVCEVADLDDDNLHATIDLDSPFVNVDKVNTPSLSISEAISSAVVSRGRAMQLFKKDYVDSLAQFTGRKEQFPYLIPDATVYNLDDYTRFQTVKEVLVEITPEVRVRGRKDNQNIQVLVHGINSEQHDASEWETSLVLLDGVPVFKHSDMMKYDAMLLQAIEVWPSVYLFADRTYSGVVNFVSKSGNMAFMEFGSNAKIVDYQGLSYPMEFTTKYNKNGDSDLRQTIFWKPEVELSSGESMSINCLIPEYSGKFDVVIEGVTSDGEPVYRWTTFFAR